MVDIPPAEGRGGVAAQTREVHGAEEDREKTRHGPRVALTVLVAGGALGWALAVCRPKDPIFEVVNVAISGFKMRFVTDSPLLVAVMDLDVTISIKITNTNWVGIEHGNPTMDIFYKDSLLGQAKVPAGKQRRRSVKVIDVPSRMDGLEVSGKLLDIAQDFTAGKVVLRAFVQIPGEARLLFFRHPFQCEVRSTLVVNPVTLAVMEQTNDVTMRFASTPKLGPLGGDFFNAEQEELPGKPIDEEHKSVEGKAEKEEVEASKEGK